DLPATPEGRGGGGLVRASIALAAGTYDFVLDYGGEARIPVHRSVPYAHGSPTQYGPRISAMWLSSLPAGRHDIELRLATRGGVASFALYVLPHTPHHGGHTPRCVF